MESFPRFQNTLDAEWGKRVGIFVISPEKSKEEGGGAGANF